MEEGNEAKEGNIKLLRIERANQTWKEYTRQISRDQSLELAMCAEQSYCVIIQLHNTIQLHKRWLFN